MNIQPSEHFTYKKLLRFILPSIIMMVSLPSTVWWTASLYRTLWENQHLLP